MPFAVEKGERSGGIAQRARHINQVTYLGTLSQQGFICRQRAHNLNTDSERASSGVTAHQREFVFRYRLGQPLTESVDPELICFGQGQSHGHADRTSAHSSEVGDGNRHSAESDVFGKHVFGEVNSLDHGIY